MGSSNRWLFTLPYQFSLRPWRSVDCANYRHLCLKQQAQTGKIIVAVQRRSAKTGTTSTIKQEIKRL